MKLPVISAAAFSRDTRGLPEQSGTARLRSRKTLPCRYTPRRLLEHQLPSAPFWRTPSNTKPEPVLQ